MQIPPARIEQLKSLYKTAFGCELTDEQYEAVTANAFLR